ncbi:hypothetical protein L6164_035790 [Bauhinia variegata]|uniref:Uncharacterized protein n=1 Tax=Bauhinia variegata TaxID=167791 RepID=A0ACB9KF40_BAUVA|nr:hypothetical protein L6164_035790 [Bauhinia variegata]
MESIAERRRFGRNKQRDGQRFSIRSLDHFHSYITISWSMGNRRKKYLLEVENEGGFFLFWIEFVINVRAYVCFLWLCPLEREHQWRILHYGVGEI